MNLLLRAILVIALSYASVASAQLLYGVSTSASGGGTPTPPAGCTGTINLSTGCVQPMLGVL